MKTYVVEMTNHADVFGEGCVLYAGQSKRQVETEIEEIEFEQRRYVVCSIWDKGRLVGYLYNGFEAANEY